MLKLKAPLIIAGATCVLSMLIGLISGVRFLHILGRGLIAGVGAGSVVLCARILLERFIPDLFTPPAPSDTADVVDSSSGSNINITLDDDLSVGASAAGASNTVDGTAPKCARMQGRPQSTATASVASTPAASDHDSMHKESAFSDAAPVSFDGGSQENGGLSDLPNMGALIADDDFAENIDTIDDNVPTNSGGFSMTGIQTDGTDSKVMAQAIRTVLATED